MQRAASLELLAFWNNRRSTCAEADSTGAYMETHLPTHEQVALRQLYCINTEPTFLIKLRT